MQRSTFGQLHRWSCPYETYHSSISFFDRLAVPTSDAATFILTLAEHVRSNGSINRTIGDEEKMDIGDQLADTSDVMGVSKLTSLKFAIKQTLRRLFDK
jgi:hypothetical protein